MLPAGFEPTTPVFERKKIVHALDHTVTVIGHARLPRFLDNRVTDGGDVSLTRRPHFNPQEYSWYSFLLKIESTPGP
jgi:hypothetical protein